MIKSILILITLQTFLFGSEQIVLVVAEDFNTSKASLECYEDGKKVCAILEVTLGGKGLGWGLGELALTQKESEPLKKEGDTKAPAGVFKLSKVFGYEKQIHLRNKESSLVEQNLSLHMPYLYASKELICVDDVKSELYNQILHMPSPKPKSFELMRRDDHQYELGVVVEHNKAGVRGAGSCIFLHVQKTKGSSTHGCTAMSLGEVQEIVSWLDESKNPILIQIVHASSDEILKHYPQLKSSKLLQDKE